MADPIAPKMKKLPFKPTALRRAAASPAVPSPSTNASAEGKQDRRYDDGLELFRRAKEMAPIITADRERRLRKKKLKKAEEAVSEARPPEDWRASPTEKQSLEDNDDGIVAETHEDTPPDPQDRELCTAQADELQTVKGRNSNELATPPPSNHTRVGTVSSKKRNSSEAFPDSHAEDVDDSPSARRLRSHGEAAATHSTRSGPAVASGLSNAPLVLVSDSEEDAAPTPTIQPRRRRSSSVKLVDSQPSQESYDDEFGEYVRRAAEKRAQTLAQQSSSSSTAARKVDVMVHSPIEGTVACRIKTFFDKPLVGVRNAWLSSQIKNRVQISRADDLILTWRQNKVYNYSSLRDLGIRPYGEYGVITDGNSSQGLCDDGTVVSMEVWTPQLLAEHVKEEELRRKRDAGELSDEEEDQQKEAEESDIMLKIFLKARDMDPLGLTVRPGTTVETLVTAFRAKRSITQDREVTLRFDGELLEEYVTMEDAEIDDMDTIEVHIK